MHENIDKSPLHNAPAPKDMISQNEVPFPPIDPTEFAGKKIVMLLYLSTPAYLPPMHHEAVSLARAGAEVTAICWSTDPSAPPVELLAERFTLRRMPFRSLRIIEKLFGLSPSNRLRAAAQYLLTYAEFTLRGFARAWREKGDLYEAHDLPTLLPMALAAALRRKPLVYYAHELYPEMHKRVTFAGAWKRLERFLVPHADLVVTPEPNRSEIYAREYGARRTPLAVMNCPPYREPIVSTKLHDALGERGVRARTIVLYQGLFDDSRCIEELVAAAGLFDDGVVLVLMGSGFQKWKDPAKVVGASEHIVVLPRVDYHQLPLYTASADIGVLLYRNDCRNNYYCAPNKVHEYMMMGLPMVTVDFPGIRSLVEKEGIGLCVDPENPDAIARAVNLFARDKDLYAGTKSRCLRAARERYAWEFEFETIRKAYSQLFKGHH